MLGEWLLSAIGERQGCGREASCAREGRAERLLGLPPLPPPESRPAPRESTHAAAVAAGVGALVHIQDFVGFCGLAAALGLQRHYGPPALPACLGLHFNIITDRLQLCVRRPPPPLPLLALFSST